MAVAVAIFVARACYSVLTAHRGDERLHLGLTRERQIRALLESIAGEEPALTVLAGDVGEGLARFQTCLGLFADLPGEQAVVAGNHDVWAHNGVSSRTLWEQALPDAVAAAGMLWLEQATWRRGTVAVAGSLAWYDYTAADSLPLPAAYFAAHKGEYTQDARFLDWDEPDTAFAQRLGSALCDRLAELEGSPALSRILVITHVPLFAEQLLQKPGDRRWGLSNAYFGNLTLGQQVAAFHKVVGVVSGHTHIPRKGTVLRAGAPELLVEVVPSDYGAPGYVVVTVATGPEAAGGGGIMTSPSRIGEQ